MTHTLYLQSLASQLELLYNIQSRAQAADIYQEVVRINLAVQQMAAKHLSPLAPLVDFQTTLLQAQDSSNKG